MGEAMAIRNKREVRDSCEDAVRPALDRRELLRILAGIGAAVALPAAAQDPAKVSPRTYKVIFENDRARVLEYVSKPGLGVCGQGRHFHPAHLTMMLTDGTVKGRRADGKAFSKEGKAGDVFAAPAETHEVENVGGRAVRMWMVEFKDKDWQPSTG
jgi:quercetin dioxygenase-like cupin family protein